MTKISENNLKDFQGTVRRDKDVFTTSVKTLEIEAYSKNKRQGFFLKDI